MGKKRRNKSRPSANNVSADVLSDGEAYWYRGGSTFSTDTVAGEVVGSDSLMSSATCYACSKVLSETVAGLPGTVYRTLTERKQKDTEVHAHELLIEQANPEMDAYTFWELATTRVCNVGNFFAEIQRDGADRPVALWPIHPSRVTPMRDQRDGTLYWQVAHDWSGSPEFADPTWREQHLTYLSDRNMLNIVGFGSSNGIISQGLLPATNEIGMDFATRRFGASFFNGGATPSGFVSHPGFIDDPNKRTLFRDDLNRVHNNKTGGNKIGVLWQGATYTAVSIAPDQAQFLETRKFTADQICKFYGVPPAIIGDYEHSKFATADAMIRAFVMLTLRNLCVRMEKSINRQVLNVRGVDGRLSRAFTKPLVYQFALDGLLRGDPKTRAETWHMMRMSGAVTGNEWRAEEGMNPMDGEEGDWVIVQGGSVRLSQIDNQGTRASNTQPKDPAPSQAAIELAEKAKANVAEALEQTIDGEKGIASAAGSTLPDNPVLDSIIDIAQEAISRVHQITLTQIERWRTQDPCDVQSKLGAFWTKQQERLLEALEVADKLALRIGAQRVSAPLATAYVGQFAECDSHTIFAATNNVNTVEIVQSCV